MILDFAGGLIVAVGLIALLRGGVVLVIDGRYGGKDALVGWFLVTTSTLVIMAIVFTLCLHLGLLSFLPFSHLKNCI